jgi:hypothetical protein
MIATRGDEAFVMFAIFPKQATIITMKLLVTGVLAGYLTDKFYCPKDIAKDISGQRLELHNEQDCQYFEKDKLWSNLSQPSSHRLALATGIVSLTAGLATGLLAGKADIWIKTTLVLSLVFVLFIVMTASEHFLKKHIWDHIVKVHLPRIFLWVFGVMLIMHYINIFVNVEAWISNNLFTVLLIAVLIGIIPESGPHLVFVTLFASGAVPFSILIANSISQDGHGMLPLFAESKKAFFAVKAINMSFALLVGGVGVFLGI